MISHNAVADTETAGSICVINTVTGEVVYEKDAYERRPMASTTKIMTLVTALENSRPDEIVTVSRDASYQEGSSAYTKPNSKITMNDLCYGLMLNSGNDAAVAIAEHIKGTTDAFAVLMNETARKIGADDTNFVNPNGLHDDAHYTTASDLAKLTRYAMQNPKFREIVGCKMYTSHMILSDGSPYEVEFINHNRLLKELDGCVGVKTGFTKNAGRCLVSAIDIDGAKYIVVTLNDSDDWNTHKKLYEDVIKDGRNKVIVKSGDCMKHAVSATSECPLIAKDDFAVFVNSSDVSFEVVKNIPEKIDFPLNEGEKVGYIEIKTNDNIIGTVDVVAKRDFIPTGIARTKDCFLHTLMRLIRNTI